MTKPEWLTSIDPARMIQWLEKQGFLDPLWDFALACCHRVWDKLPGEAFRGVVKHAEQIGSRDIDDALSEARREISRLQRRLLRASNPEEESRLNRKLGFGKVVMAFEQQDCASVARTISEDLIAWSKEAEQERSLQAELLRKLVPDPSLPMSRDED